MKTLKHLIFIYPQQTLLFLLNSSLFIWIQTNIAHLLQSAHLTELYDAYAPFWLKALAVGSVERFEQFLRTSSMAWLVASLVLLFIWKWLSRLVRLVLTLLLLSIAVWLIWKSQLWLTIF